MIKRILRKIHMWYLLKTADHHRAMMEEIVLAKAAADRDFDIHNRKLIAINTKIANIVRFRLNRGINENHHES